MRIGIEHYNRVFFVSSDQFDSADYDFYSQMSHDLTANEAKRSI